MIMSASKLRENIYKILDQALITGESIEIQRNGKILKIVPPKEDKKKSKLANLKKHQCIVGHSHDLSQSDWMKEWEEEWNELHG